MNKYIQKDVRSVTYFNYDLFEIKWFVTDWCNYKCWYCCQGTNNKNKWLSEDYVIQVADKLNQFIKKSNITKRLSLQILGGEICFYDWTKILPHIDNVAKVFITTNFSNTLDYYKNLYEYCYSNNIKLQLLCSYHEVGDKFFEKYLTLLHWTLDNDYKTPGITYVVNNDFDFSMYDKFPELHQCGADFATMLNPDGTATNLIPEVREKLEKLYSEKPTLRSDGKIKVRNGSWVFDVNGELIKTTASKFFKDLEDGCLNLGEVYCDAGFNSLCINSNADIVRCSNNNTKLGNLFDCDLKLNWKSSICKGKHCMLCHPVNICRTRHSTSDPFIDYHEEVKENINEQ